MRSNKRLQAQITTGRITLPVVILLSIGCWIAGSIMFPNLKAGQSLFPTGYNSGLWNLPQWIESLLSLLLYAVAGYSLIALNNLFGFIRMRASVQTSVYFILVAICPFIHKLYAGNIASAFLIVAFYFLFKSYQQIHSSGVLFYTFLCIGIGSLFFPQLTFFIPIFWIGAYNLQSLSLRSLLASIIGFTLPYWFLFGHAYFYNDMQLFYAPFQELATFHPIDYIKDVPVWAYSTLGYVFLIYAISSIHCIMAGYEDKIQTRVYLNFLIFLNFCFFIYIILQPIQGVQVLPLLLVGVSILTGHLFVLTNSKASNLFFIFAIACLAGLFGFNIWMLLFNS